MALPAGAYNPPRRSTSGPPRMSNFFDRIADTARRFPERPAIEWVGASESQITTYAELGQFTARTPKVDDVIWLGALKGTADARVKA